MRAAALILASLVASAWACAIQGTDSGECQTRDEYEFQMPFCQDVVRYTACVPRYQPLYPNHTLAAKDAWVSASHARVVAERSATERNDTLRSLGENEHGIPGEVVERFFENEDCIDAYKNFLCWLNFPRCDEEGRSLILCGSVCENLFRSCRYSEDLWRCYEPSFYGGKAPEEDKDVDKDGLPVYWRAPFPGQPFRANSFDENGDPIAVCTPSILNGAATAGAGVGVVMWLAALVAVAVVARAGDA
ncbi:hypothetical protein FNF27_01392 [Cafeteria roenbergensis]|uniref:FZ domain-containing protein n=1 Tax=Cafeteria roenbergensis TaxID=33653 RepID=A0A5A8EHN5_CAFRO|nr:hypothetical protein FNF27_01392 [Cafeteria roenbergensis]